MSLKFYNPILWPLTAPLSAIYASILSIRNWCYDKHIFKAHQYSIPIVNIGNIAVGGTGKTPHIDLLINLLKEEYRIATLSRGYGRQSKGFVLADKQHNNVHQIGDESLLMKQKHPEIIVAVCENRNEGVQQLLHLFPDLDVILLDDAFQHRAIKPSINIMLSDYNRPFFNDYVMPMGTLRERRNGFKRADAVIVTKCPQNIDYQTKDLWSSKLQEKKIFWSRFIYQDAVNEWTDAISPLEINNHYLLVTGIANPQPLQVFLDDNEIKNTAMIYLDHYDFKETDVLKWINILEELAPENRYLLTTEKDIGRILPFRNLLQTHHIKLLKLPIHCAIEGGFASIIEKIKKQISEWRKIRQDNTHL